MDDLPGIDEIRRDRMEMYSAITRVRAHLDEFRDEYQNAISVPVEDAMALHALAVDLVDAVEFAQRNGNELADSVYRFRQRMENRS